MKKFLAILMVLCMFACAAMAESAEVNWADVEPSVAEAGIEGNFVSVADLGIKMFVPAGFQEAELSDEDVQAGYISYLTTEDQSAVMAIMYADLGGASLEDYANTLPQVGATEIEPGTINGIPVVTYDMPENNTLNVAMLTDTGYGIEFIFSPANDDGLKSVAAIMTASIQPE